MCSSVHEMLNKLKVIYEGTSEVKETTMNLLIRDYELFAMKPEEMIPNMYARLSEITNGLTGLGKDYSNRDLVRKVLCSLSPQWHTKATVIEDSNYLRTLTMDELIGSLMTYEINIKRTNEENKKKKMITLNAYPTSLKESDARSSIDSEEEELIALTTRRARKYFRREGNFSRRLLRAKQERRNHM